LNFQFWISVDTFLTKVHTFCVGGTMFGTTPGGSKIVYDRLYLMKVRDSPASHVCQSATVKIYSTHNLGFRPKFDFWSKFRFSAKIRFFVKIWVFGQNSIFDQNFGLRPKFHFWSKFRFSTKIPFLVQISFFCLFL